MYEIAHSARNIKKSVKIKYLKFNTFYNKNRNNKFL